MTTNKKSVQQRADEKRRDKRARAWQCVVYPDGAPENWMDVLRDLLVECLVSPLHDKDRQEEDRDRQKKPHYHVIVSFKNPMSYTHAVEVFDAIGGVYPDPEKAWHTFLKACKVRDFQQAARYLCHLDQPNKYQYDIAQVTSIGAIDYAALVMTQADEDEILDEIFQFMDDYHVETYPMLIRLVRKLHPEWRRIVYHTCTRQVVEYAKGLHHEAKNGAGPRTPRDYDIHAEVQVPSADDVAQEQEIASDQQECCNESSAASSMRQREIPCRNCGSGDEIKGQETRVETRLVDDGHGGTVAESIDGTRRWELPEADSLNNEWREITPGSRGLKRWLRVDGMMMTPSEAALL
ncbi:Rep family protein [Xiamenia xianingshaonis]|nr:Rep family protein [Xiamenia xianingshaonis]